MLDKTGFTNCKILVEAALKKCVDKILETGELIHLQKGAFLPDNSACWLEAGNCVLSLDDSRGDTLSLFYFRPGQLVNFLPLLTKSFPIDPAILKRKIPAQYFHVKALTDCRLYTINPEWFVKEFAKDSTLPCLFLQSAMQNLINSYVHVWNMPILSNTQRICMLILASLDEEQNMEIPAYLTQAEISRHLSMHPITVAKIFGKLRKLGVINKIDQQLVVTDPVFLQALAEGQKKITY